MGAEVSIKVFLGATWEQEFIWKYASTLLPVDLTGWTSTMEFFNSAGTVRTTLTSAGGTITLTTATGSVLPSMSKAVTAALSTDIASYKLHMDHAATSYRHRLAWGRVELVA